MLNHDAFEEVFWELMEPLAVHQNMELAVLQTFAEIDGTKLGCESTQSSSEDVQLHRNTQTQPPES